ncbi:MAG: hypothetical protein M1834_002731 [Cirrosporium novae-zelandiae]|nr:MAG: hypothetical protein M1834_002731 [Cirrosporium novae-zelandiae]
MSIDTVKFAQVVSWLLGWIYFLCWSLSFYPQPILNWRRKSVRGLSIDFPTINAFGFICYFASTTAMLFSSTIRNQYAIRNPISPEPTVQLNDFAYGLHAVILSSFIYTQFWPQIWSFKTAPEQKASSTIIGIISGCITAIAIVSALVIFKGKADDAIGWAWLDVAYATGYVKLVVTFVKYIPQAWINYKLKSTAAWSIEMILLDITGGFLSLIQLAIDSSLENDWSGVTGNPVKFGLGNITLVFDTIFIVQHYILYRHSWTDEGEMDDEESERRGLLAVAEGDEEEEHEDV